MIFRNSPNNQIISKTIKIHIKHIVKFARYICKFVTLLITLLICKTNCANTDNLQIDNNLVLSLVHGNLMIF